MKKTILSIIMGALSILSIDAQPVSSYGFECKQGIYDEISGGTVVYSGTSGSFEDTAFDGITTEGIKALSTTAGIPIGFNFTFNDLTMNKFVIGACGYLMLGKDNIRINPDRSAFLLSGESSDVGEGKQNVVAASVFSTLTGIPSTQISYKLTGTAPNRMLVVQFKDLQYDANYSGDKIAVSLQIRLYETSNKTDIVLKNWTNTAESSNKLVRIGLKGNDGDFQVRGKIDDSWTNTEKRMENSYLNWTPNSFPADGLTYTYTIPAVCEKPASQPTELKLTSSSIQIEGSFKEALTADHYLVLMSETSSFSANPADKTYYKAGDKIGNATVISYDTSSSFATPENLSGSKTYYFRVYAVNSFCQFGPIYNVSNPLEASINTLPDMPQAMSIKETQYDNFTIAVTGSPTGNPIIIAATDETDGVLDGYPTEDGVFGTPSGILNIGDQLTGGGKIVYKGIAKDDIKIGDLKNNAVYHFKAWSVNNDNGYSTTSVTANGLTWGKLPYYANFQNTALYSIPFGWESTGNTFRIVKKSPNNGGEEAYQLECNLLSGDPTNGKENSVTTQWILLNNTTNRILFNYNLTVASRFGNTVYTWDERDALEIQISNNGNDFTTIYTINSGNAAQLATLSSWGTGKIQFDNFKGVKVKIRLKWKTYAPSVKLLVENFIVEEKPACDYPLGLSVDQSSIVGSQASIDWTATNEENAWDIRFRKVGDENWGAPIEVRTKPYLLKTLPTSSNIELQIRAKCSLTSSSPWSKSLMFTSGYAIPFAENFDKIGNNSLPVGWITSSGLLDNPTELCTGGGMGCTSAWLVNQKAIKIRYSSQPKDWAITPKIDFNDGSVHGKLEFDLSINKTNQNPAVDGEYFAVVISRDGGTTFNKDDVAFELKKDDLVAIGQSIRHCSVDLSKYNGFIKIGFYAYAPVSGSGDQLVLDNIELKETCPPATNAKTTEVTTESAKISWEGESEEWLTFLRKAGETKKEYTKQVDTHITLTGLTPKTNYEFGITKSCAIGDTARIAIVSFTTQSLAPCLQPTEITTTPAKKSVTISWSGEADNYNVRFRQAGSEEWIKKTTQTHSITVDGLEPDTEYEYTIQSVCSSADGDISEWTETTKVSTKAITCFPPTEIATVPTYKSATVTWNSEADNFQLAFRTGENQWTVRDVKNAKSLILDNLPAATKYTLRMRSICVAGDTSDWSSTSDFQTLEIPVCTAPTNLTASGITATSAKLEWEADNSNLNWDLRYRPGTSTSWTTVNKLEEKSYQANDLIPNTAYLWSVKATCDEGRTSAWAQDSFSTLASGISNIGSGDLKVYVSRQIINIQNPSNVRIDHVCLYNTNGQLLRDYSINSDENVMIPTNLDMDKVIVKVFGQEFTSSYTLIMK